LSVYITQDNKLTMLSIFGYRGGNSTTSSTAFVVAGLAPQTAPHEITLVDLLASMDLSKWKNLLENELLTAKNPAERTRLEFLQQLKSFNIITFQEGARPSLTPPTITSPPPQSNCIIL
jgi:hypothetical protein